jgi:hypothetical protein
MQLEAIKRKNEIKEQQKVKHKIIENDNIL